MPLSRRLRDQRPNQVDAISCAGISAVALGIGPLAGGALVDLDWRLIFWINLPIAALGIAIMAIAAPVAFPLRDWRCAHLGFRARSGSPRARTAP